MLKNKINPKAEKKEKTELSRSAILLNKDFGNMINSKKSKTLCTLIASICLYSTSTLTLAETASNHFPDVVKHAIESNPEIQASWHNFIASGYDIDAAQSGYRPTLDFLASYGFEWNDYKSKRSYDGASVQMTLTQMLYDGLRTSNDIKRFSNLQLVRYFELLDSIENTTLSALKAYEDVLRFRELARLAEENLAEHISVYNQIEESARAGVARRADLEQISGRLSLAETNLLIELSNLHDVSARYLRIVGALPGDNLTPLQFNDNLVPANTREALHLAYQANPGFHAAIRNVEAAKANEKLQKGILLPELSFNARHTTRTFDSQGTNNQESESRAALDFRLNIYKGGRDIANINKATHEHLATESQKDASCVVLREAVQTSLSNIRKLDEQIPFLNQHRISSDNVRMAYKNQFDIGQRSLLDVLDSENEFFQASRAYVNALADRNIVAAESLTLTGQLLTSLNIVREGLPTLEELGADSLDPTELACEALDLKELTAQR
ncbi:hypothetical protein DN062_06410 [Nitrincola tibetensis]|uniref:Channel protein TolC n=1 Tax=Nitrincola tibetensis TaxID=2219697 RepID=A0A364NMT1_9GAMM|nr:TolC family outer membrane protein [Nitrincola tibetensis]RAU18406.1 hypothetical protein DN062_06410 [Nitrincola tibetensis]